MQLHIHAIGGLPVTRSSAVYSEFRLRSKILCCVRNLEGLRTQPGRLRTCGHSPHVYMNCAIARVLVTETVNCEAKAGLV